MTAVYGQRVPFPNATGTLATAILDASGDKIGGIFCAPKDGSIDRVQLYCSATAGTPPSYTVRLETLSGGFPSGSLAGANASGSVTPTASTLHTVTLTASLAVNTGDFFGIVLNSASADGTNNATFNYRSGLVWPISLGFPRAVQDLSAGSWSLGSETPYIVPLYSDGEYFPLCVPNVSTVTTAYDSGTTPDEIGSLWVQAGKATCYGSLVHNRFVGGASDGTVKLYDSSDNLLASASITGADIVHTTGNLFWRVHWDGVTLNDGETCRLTMVPGSLTDMSIPVYTFASEAMRQAITHSSLTQRTNAGAWTNDAASFVATMPLLSAITYPTLPAVSDVRYPVDRGDGTTGTISMPNSGTPTGTENATSDACVVSGKNYGAGNARTGTAVVPGNASHECTLTKETGANARGGSGTCAKLDPTSTIAYGYWQWFVPATASTAFVLSFYFAKSVAGFNGNLKVSIYDTDNSTLLLTSEVVDLSSADTDYHLHTCAGVTPTATGLCRVRIEIQDGAVTGDVFIDDIAVV